MAENLDSEASNLLCSENSMTCFDDLDSNAINGFGVSPSCPHQSSHTLIKDPVFDNIRSNSLMGFPLQSEERVKGMLERESELLPRDDYLHRLRSGDLELSVRREALDWIWKASAHYQFGAQCVCLSTNFLDRFLSVYELPRGKAWIVQLLAVACLSLAAKLEESKVPQSVDLQVGEPKFVFEAKTIQRMELLVLSTLKWRLQVFTPCSFVDYYLQRISSGDQYPSNSSISRSIQLILSTIKGIDFLEFRPSEIAAAVAISVAGETQTVDIGDICDGKSCFIHVRKERVMKCVEMIKDLTLISGSSASASCVPQSPDGVLDAACLSYKSDDLTVGSCANYSDNSPDIKRRKQDRPHPKS